eukprot:5704646-Amphidinium_carterae.2
MREACHVRHQAPAVDIQEPLRDGTKDAFPSNNTPNISQKLSCLMRYTCQTRLEACWCDPAR